MKLALILNAIDTRIGGVLIRGERGTGKSTAARALAVLLPEIEVIVGSPFNDDPNHPNTWSDQTRERAERGEQFEVERRKTGFIDLPVSVTEDRVVGTLDIEKAIKQGERHFEPGVLANANRGILYIDEVNLLDDHVVDLLLDSAAMGVNVVEREGISFSHPARFILVGTMNPEEGDLRPQLLDRFGLSVEVRGIDTAKERVEILRRHIAYEADADAFRTQWAEAERDLSERIAAGREFVDKVEYSRRDLFTIAKITTLLKIDGHRADLVILKAARAHAAFEQRLHVEDRDILLAAKLAIPHRLRHGPFADGQMDVPAMQVQMERIKLEWAEDNQCKETNEPSEPGEGDEQSASKKKSR
ncbi:MAG: ATP-binding protein [Sterolibacterium sp.]